MITTLLGVGIMSLSNPLPMDRVYLVNPGQKITVGDRTLTAFKPPAFDNPSTTGFYDDKSGVLFSSDCFGALLSEVPQNAADLSDKDLREGQLFWAVLDRRGCTKWTGAHSQGSWTASAGWRRR